jgi:hypothetical protein
MASSVLFSDIQLLNLSFLLTIQASIREDPVAACYKYRVRAEQASRLADLAPEQMQRLVANLGHQCLFMPRDDILQLLEAPPGLLAPLSSVRASQPDAATSRNTLVTIKT